MPLPVKVHVVYWSVFPLFHNHLPMSSVSNSCRRPFAVLSLYFAPFSCYLRVVQEGEYPTLSVSFDARITAINLPNLSCQPSADPFRPCCGYAFRHRRRWVSALSKIPKRPDLVCEIA